MRHAAPCQAAARSQTDSPSFFFPDPTIKMMNMTFGHAGTPAAETWNMSLFRFVALLPLVTAAGCYSDASTQSTLPSTQLQPQHVSGPPGGGMDPGYGYDPSAGNPRYQPAGPPLAANTPAPSEMAPEEAGPGPAIPAPGPADSALGPAPDDVDQDVAEAPPAPDAPADPTAGVTDTEIDTTLSGYGQWVDTDDYGQVWRPDATVVGVDFTPYESGGSWAYTDAGWAFACDYPWGWLPFHYGRWAWFHDYWGWVPGHRWSPAWVEWRHGGGFVGWRPMAPGHRDPNARDFRHGSGPLIRDHRHAEQHDAHWRFATVPDFGRPHIRSHIYGNPAEGLRVTSTVAAPPVRARTTVPAGSLMRSRFAAGGRLTQPGSNQFGGPQQVRDHRSDPRAFQPPAQPDRPTRAQPYQTYQPPAYRPPVRAQPYNPPARTYQPPVRSYTPPARTYQPPARTYAPRPSSPPPSRSWSPPASSGSSHSSSSRSSSHSSSSSSHGSSGGSSHGSSGGGHHR